MNEPDTFIATITDDGRSFQDDMELPSDMPISELCRHIMMILKERHGDTFSTWNECSLVCNNKLLKDDDTLLKAGIFDGSVISVREK